MLVKANFDHDVQPFFPFKRQTNTQAFHKWFVVKAHTIKAIHSSPLAFIIIKVNSSSANTMDARVPDPCSTPSEAPQTGTSIVACIYRDGVVIGADSMVSTGTYVSNRASDKLTPLADLVWLLRSGSAADTQAISDYVRLFVNQHEIEVQRQVSVLTVANLVKTMNYQNKDALLGAMIIAGYDSERGPQIFGCPLGGSLVEQKWAADGSGSTYIWGYMDANYKEGFTLEEAENFVKTALTLAKTRDGSSGGLIRTVVITKDGIERKMILPKDQNKMWDEHAPIAARGVLV